MIRLRAITMVAGIASVLGCEPRAAVQPRETPAFTPLLGGEGSASDIPIPARVIVTPSRLIFLNSSPPYLQLYSWSGELVQSLGRHGAGPQEFQEPTALALDSARGRLVVFDPPNARISAYQLTDTLSFVDAKVTPLLSRDACFGRKGLYAVADHDGRLVHWLKEGATGWEIAGSWGTPTSEHPLHSARMFRNYLADGPMLCTGSDTTYVASRFTGEIQTVVAPESTTVVSTLRPFHPLEFSGTDRGGLSMSTPPDGRYQEIARLLPTRSGILAIVGMVDKDHHGGGDYRSAQSRVPGTASDTTTSQYLLLGWHENRAVCLASDPAPVVGLSSSRACP